MIGKNCFFYVWFFCELKNFWGSVCFLGCVGCWLVNYWYDFGCLRICRVVKLVLKEFLVFRKEWRSVVVVVLDRDGVLFSCRIGLDREDGCGGGVLGWDDCIVLIVVRRVFCSILYFGFEGLLNL